MYDELLEKLRLHKFINENNKVSPWIERKISNELRQEIITTTSFIKTDVKLADRIQTMLLGLTSQPLCLTCNNPTNYFRSYRNYARYCCKTCEEKSVARSEHSKRLANEGINGFGNGAKIHQYKKYNGMMANQADKSIIEKTKKTCLERYGVDNASKTPEARAKISKSRTGTKVIYKGIKPFHKHLNDEKVWLLDHPEKLLEMYIEQKITITNFAISLGFSPSLICSLFKRNNFDYPIFKGKGVNISKAEFEIQEWLDSFGIKYVPQYKLNGKKIDIVIPEFDLAIEYQGIDHSYGKSKHERFNNYEKEDSKKHLNRKLMCEEAGLELIQIFENEWLNKFKKEIWKSILKSKLNLSEKLYARKCSIRVLDNNTCNKFLKENHIQGTCSSSIKLGLYHNEELVSVMTFGKVRFSCKKKYQWELIRFCNKLNTNIVGGASKLFNHFIKNYDSVNIISYCDRRMFVGDLYENLKFQLLYNSHPNYVYTKNGKILSRYQCQKHKLKDILGENYDETKTEISNMIDNEYRILWDCGNSVYLWEK